MEKKIKLSWGEYEMISKNYGDAINYAFYNNIAKFTSEELDRVTDLFKVFIDKTFDIEEAKIDEN